MRSLNLPAHLWRKGAGHPFLLLRVQCSPQAEGFWCPEHGCHANNFSPISITRLGSLSGYGAVPLCTHHSKVDIRVESSAECARCVVEGGKLAGGSNPTKTSSRLRHGRNASNICLLNAGYCSHVALPFALPPVGIPFAKRLMRFSMDLALTESLSSCTEVEAVWEDVGALSGDLRASSSRMRASSSRARANSCMVRADSSWVRAKLLWGRSGTHQVLLCGRQHAGGAGPASPPSGTPASRTRSARTR